MSNKFIKREIFIKAINSIDEFYLNQYMIRLEDGLINFSLHQHAKSLFILKKVGYYYSYNKNSVTRKKDKKQNIKFIFLYLKFIFENTKVSKYEKDMCFCILNKYLKNINKLEYIQKDFDFYEGVINKLLNYEFINEVNKNKLEKMKKLIKKKI